MRIINHIVFLLALLGAIIFAAVNWSFFQTPTYVYFYFGTARVPLNLIALGAYLAVLFVQWLVVQGAWVFRNRKLQRADKEILRLKARLYDLTEGTVEVDFYLDSQVSEAQEYDEARSEVFRFALSGFE